MRFGTFPPQVWKGDLDGVPVEEQWPRILSHAEQAGFDSLWAATVSEATDVMGQFAEAGCAEMIVYSYDTGEGDSQELYASEVIPQLR